MIRNLPLPERVKWRRQSKSTPKRANVNKTTPDPTDNTITDDESKDDVMVD
jgi:hypothetical protein